VLVAVVAEEGTLGLLLLALGVSLIFAASFFA
jgi:hypothetical protein